jgi:hypothetical protein
MKQTLILNLAQMGIKQNVITKQKGDSFYARIAEKGRINRENDDLEDITICDWIDYIKRFKEDERRREEAERL